MGVSCLGIAGISIALIVSFTPSSTLLLGSKLYYDLFLVAALGLIGLLKRVGRKARYALYA
jgi:hypothetical protein